ncbi:MAG: iron-containing alcohol dehydrogenase [Candidatus Hodarchaeales archaeon]|jgi:alcohol dehydrogenase class IV
MWDFTSPRKVIFGEDALEYFSEQSFKRVFVVTDPMIRKIHFHLLEKQFRAINAEITVFDEIPGEPTLQNVEKGAKLLAETKPDVIVALGGGSVMDAAKGMWPMWASPEEGMDAIEGLDPFGKLNLREITGAILINIPTTSGTGSDVTWATVLTDNSTETERKASFGNRELVADVTILDPILTKTLPRHLIAGTGLDALGHAIDAYLSTWRNDFSDAFLLHAIKLLWENISLAYEQAETGEVDSEIREKLHNAATMSGWGMGNSQIIIGHALSHSIGAAFNIPHSKCTGTTSWYSLMYNKGTEYNRIADLARAVGMKGKSDVELTDKLILGLKNLLIELDLPLSLAAMGVTKKVFNSKIESVIEYALNDSGTLSNPRPADYEDYVKIFEYLFDGKELDF